MASQCQYLLCSSCSCCCSREARLHCLGIHYTADSFVLMLHAPNNAHVSNHIKVCHAEHSVCERFLQIKCTVHLEKAKKPMSDQADALLLSCHCCLTPLNQSMRSQTACEKLPTQYLHAPTLFGLKNSVVQSPANKSDLLPGVWT